MNFVTNVALIFSILTSTLHLVCATMSSCMLLKRYIVDCHNDGFICINVIIFYHITSIYNCISLETNTRQIEMFILLYFCMLSDKWFNAYHP